LSGDVRMHASPVIDSATLIACSFSDNMGECLTELSRRAN
jgi:hypothetical protein